MSTPIDDAYYSEKHNIQDHYARVISELDIVRNDLHKQCNDEPSFSTTLNALCFIRNQSITDIGFEVKEFNQWTLNDQPVAFYPTGRVSAEIAKIQDDIKLMNLVKEGSVYGNIFSAKSLVYISCPNKKEDIASNATQIFPLTLEQFQQYVTTIGNAINSLHETVQHAEQQLSNPSEEQLFDLRQDHLATTMKQLNQDILGPMNDWRDLYLGEQDEKSEVSRREMKL